MDFILENENLKVVVCDLGAELKSIYGKTTNFEYLWQGDSKFWEDRAPNLFPTCGRVFGGKYTYKGKTYQMEIHGFARKNVFTLEEQSSNRLLLKLTETEETLKIYPFKFNFFLEYILDGNKLTNRYIVKNTGDEVLPFSVGAHPGFNMPLQEGVAFHEHYLEFSSPCKPKSFVFNEEYFYTGKNADYPIIEDRILPVSHEMFDNDSIFFENISKEVTLKTPKSNRYVKINFENMPTLGLWHTSSSYAPFICIEPWDGIPGVVNQTDDLSSKAGLHYLESGKTFTNSIDIEVNE